MDGFICLRYFSLTNRLIKGFVQADQQIECGGYKHPVMKLFAMAQVLSIAKIRYLQDLLQYSLNLKVLYPLPCIPGYKATSNSRQYKSNSCLFATIHKNMVENGHFLIIQFLHSPPSPC